MYLLDIKSSSTPTGKNNNRKYVFNRVEFVDHNNMEAQNPRLLKRWWIELKTLHGWVKWVKTRWIPAF